MNLDFAPMEGITGSIFRSVHQQYFPGVDRYFSPFLSPTKEHAFTQRELREIMPEHNQNVTLIPQLLTKVPEDFLWAARELFDMGYREINLNLGCPSGTVTAKGKGSGMLADLKQLEQFLDKVFADAPCSVSIKTRLGLEDPEEFVSILEVYNKYPVSELIIHPRVRKDFYRHPIRSEWFDLALTMSQNPVSFNGGIVTTADYEICVRKYPNVKSVMIGQGFVSDPFLCRRIRNGAGSDRKTLQLFHDELLERYSEQFGSRNNAAKRMKELWFYLIRLFGDSEKLGKKLMKSKNAEEYQSVVASVFQSLELLEASSGGW